MAFADLDKVAEVLAGRTERILIEGHTDSRGSDSFNHEQSYKRAMAVRDHLIGRGIAADRIRAVGLGETRPVADNANAEGRANNRRGEIVLEKPKSGPF